MNVIFVKHYKSHCGEHCQSYILSIYFCLFPMDVICGMHCNSHCGVHRQLYILSIHSCLFPMDLIFGMHYNLVTLLCTLSAISNYSLFIPIDRISV